MSSVGVQSVKMSIEGGFIGAITDYENGKCVKCSCGCTYVNGNLTSMNSKMAGKGALITE